MEIWFRFVFVVLTFMVTVRGQISFYQHVICYQPKNTLKWNVGICPKKNIPADMKGFQDDDLIVLFCPVNISIIIALYVCILVLWYSTKVPNFILSHVSVAHALVWSCSWLGLNPSKCRFCVCVNTLWSWSWFALRLRCPSWPIEQKMNCVIQRLKTDFTKWQG